jgi:hypothetical protein
MELDEHIICNAIANGKNSVKRVGIIQPNQKLAKKLPDGTLVPMGKLLRHDNLISSLMYNEYIIFDEEQVELEYLVKVRFNFK